MEDDCSGQSRKYGGKIDTGYEGGGGVGGGSQGGGGSVNRDMVNCSRNISHILAKQMRLVAMSRFEEPPARAGRRPHSPLRGPKQLVR